MLATVLEASASQTDIGTAFASLCSIGIPAKYREGPGAELTLSPEILLEHLDIWVLGKAVFADGRKVGRLPAGPVEIVFDLWRHSVLSTASLRNRDGQKGIGWTITQNT